MKKDNQFYLQHILSTEIDSENQEWLDIGSEFPIPVAGLQVERDDVPIRPPLSAWDNLEDADDKLK